jgi:hypothetical protein
VIYELCGHEPHGTVSHPALDDPEFERRAHASVQVCFRPVCIERAHRWVAEQTGRRGVHVTFAERDAG